MVKIEAFLFYIGHSHTTLRIKNSFQIALSYGFWDIHTFSFSAKIQDGYKSGENWNFSVSHGILLYYPVVQKLARNRSISYGFRDIHTFSFSAKIQDGGQKWRKLKFYKTQDNMCPVTTTSSLVKCLWPYTVMFINTQLYFDNQVSCLIRGIRVSLWWDNSPDCRNTVVC